jgi:hypothetical protein
LFEARSASMISRIKFELSLVSALESDIKWICNGIESRDFNRSGAKAESIYGDRRGAGLDLRAGRTVDPPTARKTLP